MWIAAKQVALVSAFMSIHGHTLPDIISPYYLRVHIL